MPEIPDLEVFKKNLSKRVLNKKIKSVKGEASSLNKKLKGQSITAIERDGKKLFFHFTKGDIVAIHLMLHGEYYILQKGEKHDFTRFQFVFEDETSLAVVDWQRKAHAIPDPERSDVPDAMSPKLTAKYLVSKMAGRKKSIKAFLNDQDVVRGIGNAYVDEILWDARVSPFSVTEKVPENVVKQILRSIKKVYKNAIKQILRHDPNWITGEYRDFLAVHHAKKKTSPTGSPILRHKVGSKSTYYTKEQKVYR